MKRILVGLGLLLLAGCGPIFGQMTAMTDGVKEFKVVQGDLADLKGGGPLLVFGPFAKTAEAFYLCRGEDAANLSDALRDAGLFQSELYLERNYDHVEKTAQQLRGKTAAELQSELGLNRAPGKILFGTILYRRTYIAPARGIEMEVGYRLEFYDVASRQSTTVEIGVKYLAEETVKEVVAELRQKIRGG